MEYDERMDKEVLPLCNAINKLKGLETFESCCGHGKDNILIWFMSKDVESLTPLVYFLDP